MQNKFAWLHIIVNVQKINENLFRYKEIVQTTIDMLEFYDIEDNLVSTKLNFWQEERFSVT